MVERSVPDSHIANKVRHSPTFVVDVVVVGSGGASVIAVIRSNGGWPWPCAIKCSGEARCQDLRKLLSADLLRCVPTNRASRARAAATASSCSPTSCGEGVVCVGLLQPLPAHAMWNMRQHAALSSTLTECHVLKSAHWHIFNSERRPLMDFLMKMFGLRKY